MVIKVPLISFMVGRPETQYICFLYRIYERQVMGSKNRISMFATRTFLLVTPWDQGLEALVGSDTLDLRLLCNFSRKMKDATFIFSIFESVILKIKREWKYFVSAGDWPWRIRFGGVVGERREKPYHSKSKIGWDDTGTLIEPSYGLGR